MDCQRARPRKSPYSAYPEKGRNWREEAVLSRPPYFLVGFCHPFEAIERRHHFYNKCLPARVPAKTIMDVSLISRLMNPLFLVVFTLRIFDISPLLSVCFGVADALIALQTTVWVETPIEKLPAVRLA